MPVSAAPRAVLVAIAACFALGASLLGAAPARGDDPVFDRAFGAGPADVCASPCRAGTNGNAAAQLSSPYGVAVGGGELFVADQNNHRVSVYAADGTFSRAFGKGVNMGAGNPDLCSAATTCRAGTLGGVAGQLNSPYAVAVSGSEVYVADSSNNRVSVFTTGGVFVRAFGGAVNAGGIGDPNVCTPSTTCRAGTSGTGPGQLSFPLGVAVSGGEVFVADSSNSRISVFGTNGTYARSFGTSGSGAGQLSFPFSVAVSGTAVYVADRNNQRVSEFATDGSFVRAFGKAVNPSVGTPDVCTAVTGCRAGTVGGAAGQLRNPLGIGAAGGAVYVADGNHRVSAFAADGTFVRAFGGAVNSSTGDPNICTTACQMGSAGGAAGQLNSPGGVAVSATEVYVGDTSNFRVAVYGTAGGFARAFGKSVWGSAPFVCTTVTGCGAGAAGGAAAQLNQPHGVAIAGGEAFVVDHTNHRISVYSAAGAFLRAFGKGVNAGAGSPDVCTSATTCRAGTSGTAAGQLALPSAVAVSGGEVYVADQNNQRVSVFATDGTFVRAFGKAVNAGAGSPDVCTIATTCRSGTLGGAAGQFDNPTGVTVAGGEVFVTDQGNRRISVFAPDGTFVRSFGKGVNPGAGNPDICTAATTCRFGSAGGAAGQLNGPYGLAVDGGQLYVADYVNHRVSVFATDGTFVRAFGRAVNPASGNPDVCTAATTCRAGTAGGAAGQLNYPFGVGIADGALYVSERFNGRISVFGPDGSFARAFGKGVNPGVTGNADVCTPATGCRAAAMGDAAGQFIEPLGLGMSGTTVYVADRLNHRVSVYRVTRTELSRDPSALAFGVRDIDDGPTAAQTSTVTNTGTEPVTFTGLTMTGDVTHFERLTGDAADCTATTALQPGQTCTVRVRFDPTVVGARAASVGIASNAPPLTIGLSGTGIQTELVRSPAALAFGARDVDEGATATQTSTVSNTGTQTITLSGLALTGDATQFERLTGAAGDCTPTTVLMAGQTCALRLRFDPTTSGAKSATLTVTSNAPALAVALTGSATQTELTRSAAALAFGDRDVDDGPTAIQTSTLTNTGTEGVTLEALTLGGQATQFERVTGATGDCAVATVLQAGQSCTVRMRFNPTSTGAKAATLTVTSNAAAVTVALTGTGVQTELSPTPPTLAFGSRDVDSGPAPVLASTIANTGTATVSLAGLAVSGDLGEFERLTGAAGDCTATTVLQAGDTCTIRARFDPTSTGPKAATVDITSDAPAIAVALTGRGVRLELTYDPASLAFGTRDVNTGASGEQTTTVINAGSETVTVSGMTFSGDGAEFSLLTGSPSDCGPANKLLPGEACTLRVRFDPGTIGSKAATLNVTSDAPPVAVALSGTGIRTELSRTPAVLAFGSYDLDEGPAEQTSTIANSGTEKVTLRDLSLSGDSVHFERATGAARDCAAGTVLGVGETCRVRVRFDPAATGDKAATLTVSSNAPTIIVDLTGSGTTTRVPPPPPERVVERPVPAPVEPARAKVGRWRLKRVGRVRVRTRRGVTRVATGYVAICPAGGPACTGRLTLKLRRRSTRTKKLIPIFLAGKTRPFTIAAGKRRRIAFRLSRRGRGLLVARRSLKAVLRGGVRVGSQPPVVRRARLRLKL